MTQNCELPRVINGLSLTLNASHIIIDVRLSCGATCPGGLRLDLRADLVRPAGGGLAAD